jgi:hypothetical protein
MDREGTASETAEKPFIGAPDALVRDGAMTFSFERIGKGTASAVPPSANKDAGFSP